NLNFVQKGEGTMTEQMLMKETIKRYKQVVSEVESILEEAIESIDKGEHTNGLEWARKLIKDLKCHRCENDRAYGLALC
ncbi:hypothetical protein COI89_19305, partial [Bacillus cereus]